MRLSEYLMGDSDFAIAMKDAANKLDNNGSYSNAYLKVPVSLPELKNRLDIICAHIQGSFEHSELEDYLKRPTPDECD